MIKLTDLQIFFGLRSVTNLIDLKLVIIHRPCIDSPLEIFWSFGVLPSFLSPSKNDLAWYKGTDLACYHMEDHILKNNEVSIRFYVHATSKTSLLYILEKSGNNLFAQAPHNIAQLADWTKWGFQQWA